MYWKFIACPPPALPAQGGVNVNVTGSESLGTSDLSGWSMRVSTFSGPVASRTPWTNVFWSAQTPRPAGARVHAAPPPDAELPRTRIVAAWDPQLCSEIV